MHESLIATIINRTTQLISTLDGEIKATELQCCTDTAIDSRQQVTGSLSIGIVGSRPIFILILYTVFGKFLQATESCFGGRG